MCLPRKTISPPRPRLQFAGRNSPVQFITSEFWHLAILPKPAYSRCEDMNMRLRLAKISCFALTLFLVPAFAGNDKNYTYLALGDSVAFGLNPLLIGPFPQPPASADKYVVYPEIVASIEHLAQSKKEVNASCPGETSGSFLGLTAQDLGCNSYHYDPLAFPFREIGLHTNYTGNQMDFAISELKSNKHINLVTLGIGSNDVLLALGTCGPGCVPGALPSFAANLTTILSRIREVYSGTLILVLYYSPGPAFDDITMALNMVTTDVANGVSAAQPSLPPIKFADGFNAFKAFGSDACSAGLVIPIPGTSPVQCDIHPTKLGQAILAAAVEAAKASQP